MWSNIRPTLNNLTSPHAYCRWAGNRLLSFRNGSWTVHSPPQRDEKGCLRTRNNAVSAHLSCWLVYAMQLKLNSWIIPMSSIALSSTIWILSNGQRVDLLGCGVAVALGLPMSAAVTIGGSLALSSSAFVLQLLKDKNQMGTRAGKASFGILLLQDLAVVPLLVVVELLAKGGTGLGKALSIAGT